MDVRSHLKRQQQLKRAADRCDRLRADKSCSLERKMRAASFYQRLSDLLDGMALGSVESYRAG